MKRNTGGPDFRIQNQFTKYLQVAAIRTRNSYLKQRSKQQKELLCCGNECNCLDEVRHHETHVESLVSEIEFAYEISSILEQLPDRAKRIIHLRIYQKFDFDEIAAAMGMTYANVRNIYYRALRQLRSHIDE